MNTSFNPSNLKSRLLKSIGANAYGQLVTVGIQLISVPLFLHYWGIELYGEWLILSAIPAYLSLSDIGFASVAANDMTMRVARGDQHGALEVYQSIWIFVCAVSLLVGAVLGSLIFYFSINDLFSITHISSTQTQQVLLVLMLYVLVGLQGGVLNAGFRSVGRYAYGTVMNNSIRLAEWLMSILLLILGANVALVAMTMLSVRFCGMLILWVILRIQIPWLHLGIHSATVEKIRELWRPAIAFMAFPLGFALNVQGMVLAIGMLLGPVAVAIFSAYRTLARLLVQATAMINQALSPEISAAYGAGKTEVLINLHRRGSSLTFWIALVFAAGLGLTGELMIGVWTRHAFVPNHLLFCLLLATSFLNVLWQASGVVLMSTNFHHHISLVFLGTTAGGLVVGYLLLERIGINGAGLALLVAELLMLYLTIKQGLTFLNDNWVIYLKAVIGNPFVRNS